MPVLAKKKAVIFLLLSRKSYSVGLGGDLLLLTAVMVSGCQEKWPKQFGIGGALPP